VAAAGRAVGAVSSELGGPKRPGPSGTLQQPRHTGGKGVLHKAFHRAQGQCRPSSACQDLRGSEKKKK